MIKLLYILSICALIASGLLFFSCCNNLVANSKKVQSYQALDIIEQFKADGNYIKKAGNQKINPLINEAQGFAVYLNPPEQPRPQEVSIPVFIPKPVVIAQKPADVTTKFNLIATSVNLLRPKESLALISEPGKGSHWARLGEHLGHFVLESVKHKTIIVRNGDIVHQLTIGSKITVDNEEDNDAIDRSPLNLEKTVAVTANMSKISSRISANKPQSKLNSKKQFQKLMPHKLQTQLIALENNSSDKR